MSRADRPCPTGGQSRYEHLLILRKMGAKTIPGLSPETWRRTGCWRWSTSSTFSTTATELSGVVWRKFLSGSINRGGPMLLPSRGRARCWWGEEEGAWGAGVLTLLHFLRFASRCGCFPQRVHLRFRYEKNTGPIASPVTRGVRSARCG